MISMNMDYVPQPTIDIIISVVNVRTRSSGYVRDQVVERAGIISAAANSLGFFFVVWGTELVRLCIRWVYIFLRRRFMQ